MKYLFGFNIKLQVIFVYLFTTVDVQLIRSSLKLPTFFKVVEAILFHCLTVCLFVVCPVSIFLAKPHFPAASSCGLFLCVPLFSY